MQYLYLDLESTFLFVPNPALSPPDLERAVYTIDVLGLNDRDLLRRARMEAYGNYRARVVEYVRERDRGASPTQLRLLREAIQNMSHPSVWREMTRQSAIVPALTSLFRQVPEATSW